MRTAILTAFPPEWDALAHRLSEPETLAINGTPLVLGTLAGKPVALMLSGISMVNAAMNTQALIERHAICRIVFSGIAGGIDSALRLGDVSVPERWGQNMEFAFAREIPGGFAPPIGIPGGTDLPAFGAMFPRDVLIGRADEPVTERRWFPADPDLLAIAASIDVPLERCLPGDPSHCLDHTPRIVPGGTGMSGSSFVDNAAYRDYLAATFAATVVDMESAAVAQVAWANRVPFVAYRSVSDLAGGDAGQNQMLTFMGLAASNAAAVVCAFVEALPD
ncbi:5'-methylthioadenosine/S-adenosylhomocysteine nucleosidase [Sphingomonas soli]|uniref:5'-methylthioadenosine/S-adenosylhomocysteine nucleosidase n=1 Tax=Sphingomonas soli TaxID=266127 RepID=UPI00082D581E|nr:5'-methylthioadenosine/S-adenosylhomocysteine nucleosidase [Sphingomonas soli]